MGESVHPLLIHEVVSTLLKYLPINELLSSRLVCSIWRSNGWTELRKRVTISFRTTNSLKSYIQFFSNHSNFLPPFNSYNFCCLFSSDDKSILTDFFSIFGSEIRKVDLQQNGHVLTNANQHYLTKLESLIVNRARIDIIPMLNSLQSVEVLCEHISEINSFQEILRVQNCLKKLKVTTSQDSALFLEKLVSTAATSFTLEHIDLNFPISGRMLRKLTSRRLQFKSVSLTLQREESLTDFLFSFLESQPNLRRFTCKFSRWWNPESEKGKLNLQFLSEISLEFIEGDLQFLTNCSALKKAIILSWRPELNKIQSDPLSSLPSVEYAVITLSGFPVVMTVLHYVTALLPGLRSFEFNANITGDTAIYSQLIRDRLPQLIERLVKPVSIY